LGASANAYTSNNHTAYLFESTDNFYPSLDELMDYVQSPFFTDENVEKEKGIIEQEIMMYDDYPEWKVYMNAIECMYKNHPVKVDIAGTAESISKIDKDILYKCYDTFYNPSNMVMCFSGDFEPEEIIGEVKERLKNTRGNTPTEIKRIYLEEPLEVTENKKEIVMEVSIPMFVIGIKDNIGCPGECQTETQRVKKHIAVEILLNILIGKSSKLYKKLYESELVLSELGLDYDFAKSYAHVIITGQSKEPKRLLEELKEEIKTLKRNGINAEEFNRIKNMIYGNYAKEYNNVSDICRMFVSDYFKGVNSFDYIEECDKVQIADVEEVLKEVFDEEKMVISIVKGKN